MALQEIRRAMPQTAMKIFVDCSIETGYDAFKALALGADAVSVGRGILPGLLKEGKEGVIKKVNRMNEELSEMMGYTGIRDFQSDGFFCHCSPRPAFIRGSRTFFKESERYGKGCQM